MLSHQILVKLCNHAPVQVLSSLELLVEPLDKTVNKKVKDSQVGTEVERARAGHAWRRLRLFGYDVVGLFRRNVCVARGDNGVGVIRLIKCARAKVGRRRLAGRGRWRCSVRICGRHQRNARRPCEEQRGSERHGRLSSRQRIDLDAH